MWKRFVVSAVVIAGCKQAKQNGAEQQGQEQQGQAAQRDQGKPVAGFGPKTIVTIDVDGFTVPVPDGYREVSEILDESARARAAAVVEGGRIIVSEAEPDKLWIAVASMAKDFVPSDERCASIAASAASSSGGALGSVHVAQTKLGPGCMIDLDLPGSPTRQYYVPHAGKLLLVTCSGSSGAAQQRARDAVCGDIVQRAAKK
jgi:hypothetical protein